MTSSTRIPNLPQTYNLPSTNIITQDIRIYIGLVVPGILDIDILKNKYEELIRQWPALGGKLVKSTNPYGFTTGTIANFGSRVISRPLASIFPFDYSIPRTSTTATIRSFPRDDPLDRVFHYDTLSFLNLPSIEEVAGLRVTVTDDATLLGFYAAHHLCDADSIYHIVRAYCDLIDGKEIPVNVLPPDANPATPMSSVIRKDEEKSIVMTEEETKTNDYMKNNPHLTSALQLGLLGCTLYKGIFRALGLRWKVQEKYIHLPGPLVNKWRAEVQMELDKEAAPAQRSEIQVTKNDIIAAWIIMATSLHSKPSSSPINFSYVLNYRPLLLQPAFSQESSYLHAMAYNIIAFSGTMSQVHSFGSSLAPMASRIHRMVSINKQPSQVRRNLQYHEANPDWIKGPVNSIKDEYFPMMTSWTFAGFNSDLDFSKALVSESASKGDLVDQGKVIFSHPLVATPLDIYIDPYIISMKDGEGGYWLRSMINEGDWKGIRKWLQ